MRMPRFRIQTMMVTVAVVAVTIWGLKTHSRWREYQRSAAKYRFQEVVTYTSLRQMRGSPTLDLSGGLPMIENSPSDVALMLKLAFYWGRLRIKYERAARYPWLLVEPDPPQPK
jgi:hypothetical protein